jgi:facilitated trehalose transporter
MIYRLQKGNNKFELNSFIKEKIFFQVVASMAISFGPFAVGLGKGYISPALASLQQPSQNYMGQNGSTIYDSIRPGGETLTITEQQGSWVASLSLLGALFGGLCSGAIVKQGRRRTLLFVSIPLSLSWVLTIFANSVELIYATAFLAGFFSAIVQVAAQVYISEIAHPSIRASLCSAAKVFSQIGLLAAFVMGAWLDWRQLAIVCAAAPLMLLITGQVIIFIIFRFF